VSYIKQFRVAPGSKVKLQDIDPRFKAHDDRDAAAIEVEEDRKKLRDLQARFYADGRCSLLICLQGMDTAGKDGTINHILGAMNPQGCRVTGFKEPSPEELAHDFLWRVHRAAPRNGQVAIFNRSHYESVLIVRVHDLVPRSVWSARYDQINAFEAGLVAENTHILKFYLHISVEEQLSRFEERLDDPTKQWKISEADYTERASWRDYQAAYEDVLTRCSTERAPWFVIPSDHKWFRDLAIARIVVEYLQGLDLKYPAPTVNLEHVRREYHAAHRRASTPE
jgi:PPK2 family polyphosphate:nucleotide phosphotransferase